MLHTTFCYGPGAAIGTGASLVFNPTNESSIRAFDNFPNPELIGLMVTHTTPAREQYVDIFVSQDPSFEKNEIIPLCSNDAFVDVANNYFVCGNRTLTVGKDWDIKGYSGGSDDFAVGLLLRYGARLPGFDPNKKTLRRRYNKGADSTADVWTSCATVTDLDPDKNYVLVGMQLLPEAAACVGARLNMAETGCKPGVVAGPEIIFPEGAAIINGNSDPIIETLVAAADEPEVILVLQEYTKSNVVTRPRPRGGMLGNQAAGSSRQGGLFNLFGR